MKVTKRPHLIGPPSLPEFTHLTFVPLPVASLFPRVSGQVPFPALDFPFPARLARPCPARRRHRLPCPDPKEGLSISISILRIHS